MDLPELLGLPAPPVPRALRDLLEPLVRLGQLDPKVPQDLPGLLERPVQPVSPGLLVLKVPQVPPDRPEPMERSVRLVLLGLKAPQVLLAPRVRQDFPDLLVPLVLLVLPDRLVPLDLQDLPASRE